MKIIHVKICLTNFINSIMNKYSLHPINVEQINRFCSTLFFFIFIFAAAILVQAQSTKKAGTKVMLPNGWSLTPTGKQIPLGDLPLNIAVSPDLKLKLL